MNPSLVEPPLFGVLRHARNVLILGAGGGFDVYAGLPLAFALRSLGTAVHLANFASTRLRTLGLDAWTFPGVALITPGTPGPDLLERTLSQWLDAHDQPAEVYAFPRSGVAPLREACESLADRLDLDAIVLVGGTGMLRPGPITPDDDTTGLAAVAGLTTVPTRLVTCLGSGVDPGVLPTLTLLDHDDAYLGVLSIPSGSREARSYRSAMAHAKAATPPMAAYVTVGAAALAALRC